MKKVLSTVLLFIILTNFIFINTAYAADYVPENTFDQSDYDDLADDGTIEIQKADGETEDASVSDTGPSFVGTIVGYIAKVVNFVPLLFQLMLTTFLEYGRNNRSSYNSRRYSVFLVFRVLLLESI